MRPHAGDVLGDRYRLTERIAVGGMGEVWRAADDVLARDVAVKVLKEEYTGDPGFLQRFRGEARHSAGLTHPNIAGTYDYGEAAGSAYLVMELVPGAPLSDLLAAEGALPPARAMSLLAQAAAGLAAAHAAGVVHRDVKPGNLLVTPDGRVKVTDFGIARAADSTPLTATGQVMGTAQYLPPEQAMGRPATPASDVYALGVVAYEALAGRRPFDGDSHVAVAMAHVHAEAPPLPAGVPEGARALVEASMAKDPAHRPPDAGVFASVAEAIAGGDDARALALLGAAGTAGITRVLPAGTAPAPTRAAAATAAAPTAAAPAAAQPPAGGPPRRRRRVTGPLLALLALLAFVVLGAVLADTAFGPDDAPGAVPTTVVTTANGDTPGTPAPTASADPTTTGGPEGVVVSAADYVGRPANAARSALEERGLVVTEMREQDTDAPEGTVVAVSEGTFDPGDTVTLVVAAAPAPAPPADPDTGTGGGTGSPGSSGDAPGITGDVPANTGNDDGEDG